ncbi:coniferyl aldehyde dehydrogenase [Mycolicibacterium diernhoferi]|uniref:Aldehyde dehydrogenase n=1 Tax=Mycolicibacterium diernhoferi TaxID=1801 RepID=A0A1Q4HGM0_9MYCO|nr:coniferyl aldehyde dehydrogenase [Mycolicibacterium diernhoferi]PEG54227.1 coniferyl aldehyde dehydrogenase [Mycolicibacterium diernhoferi]QYL25486.1 coniferyl aldehyde dehydrogenase [Mycolicibacterium diernhoferi]
MLERQRRAFIAAGPPSVALRRNRIDRLMALVLDNTDAFVDAMATDFGTRSRAASLFTEVVGIIPVIEHTRSHVPQWMKSTKLMRAARAAGFRAEVEPAPLGVVGIIGPWNFPLNLVVLPASAAFAAGNRVMIKMSEVTSHTAELMAELAPQYFEPTELTVVTGGPEVAAEFSRLPFDHLFFTGSPSVGSLVQRAAAENLVPVTLELGGKNPVVVAPDADIRRSATRIAQARMVNGGQVCVCPDYVFVPDRDVAQFVDTVRQTWQGMFGSIIGNDDYCSSVNEANFDRVIGLIEDARALGATVHTVAPPGEALPDRASRKIAPTIVSAIDDRMAIASEEIFGPVLSVLGYSALPEVIDYINARPAPLVAYWFGPDGDRFRTFVRNTRSGGVARNDFAAQMIPSAAPFGGVGRSGMGAYHGKAGFDAFSHQRTVVGTDLPFSMTGSAAPPFGRAMLMYADVTLAMARRRTRRRLS